jgi:phage major head subunit gpT-like protein
MNADYERASKSLWWDKLATLRQSSGKKEIYNFILSTAKLEELPGEGDMVYENLFTQSFECENKNWGRAIQISRYKLMDALDAPGQGSLDAEAQWAASIGVEIARHPQEMVIDLIKGGEVNLGYDGVPYFSASHPVHPFNPSFGTYANLVSGASLDPQNYSDGVAQMAGFKLPNGRSRYLVPSYLVFGPSLRKQALEITGARFISTSGQGPTENIELNTGVSPLMINEIDDDSWYLVATTDVTGVQYNPFFYQVRDPFQMLSFNPTTTRELATKNMFEWQVRGRDASVYGHPYQMIKFKL